MGKKDTCSYHVARVSRGTQYARREMKSGREVREPGDSRTNAKERLSRRENGHRSGENW